MIRVKRIDLLFIISLVVIFAQYIKIIDFNYYSQFIIASVWIGYDILCYLYRGKYKGRYASDIKFFQYIYLVPWLLISLYTMINVVGLHQNINVPLKTYVGCIITILINVMFAFSALRIFKERTLKDSVAALFIIYIVVVLHALFTKGPIYIFKQLYIILTTFTSDGNLFEIGDCTFAAGLLLLVYFFYGQKRSKKVNRLLVVCVFFVILGLKRVQILSIAIAVVIGFMLNLLRSKTAKNVMMNVASIILMAAASIYVWVINNDNLLDAWTGLDMGRYHLYGFINDYYDFNVSFLGHGYGFSNKFAEINTSFSITVLHSDILRMFVELGFIGFFVWLIYYLFIARRRITKHYGIDISYVFFLMTAYLIITYFTDNTVNYFVTQYFYCILIPSIMMENGLLKVQATDSTLENERMKT